MKKLDLNSINATINKYLSPQGMADTNKFLEEMPLRAGYGVLIAGGIVWLLAGLAVVYGTTIAKDVAAIRADLIKTEALKPVVPQLVKIPVPADEIDGFIEKVNPLYRDVTLSNVSGKINIKSQSGRYFGAFREAINHAYNGGQGWRLSVESLCVGRECKNGFLSGEFNVNKLKVQR